MTRILHSDGACSENGKPTACGGWCALEVRINDKGEESLYNLIAQGETPYDDIMPPTSIRMELKGAINALGMILEPGPVDFYCDSAYVINGINKRWYNNWNLDDSQPWLKTPANPDLWVQLVDIIEFIGVDNVRGIHIPGHRGHRWQELCDSMAVQKVKEAKERVKNRR